MATTLDLGPAFPSEAKEPWARDLHSGLVSFKFRVRLSEPIRLIQGFSGDDLYNSMDNLWEKMQTHRFMA